ncbi:MAG: hypothetical protein PHP54_01605 [Clostridia bacterium]|nr:hypothetical protein [Clostridia bacterium]
MKSKLWILFKNITANNYKIEKKFNRKNMPKTILNIIVVLLISIAIIAYSGLYSWIATSGAKQFNLEQYVPILFYLITQVFIFMFSIYRVKSILFDSLFDSADNDSLFSMPIKPNTILASRMLTLLSINYIFTILVFAPSLVVYAIISPVTVSYIVSSIMAVVFLPVIPTILSSVLGYIIALISSKVNAKKIVETIVTFAMFIVIFISVMQIQSAGIAFISNVDNLNSILNNVFIFPGLLFNAMYHTNILSLVIYVVSNIGLFFAFCLILSKGYRKIINKLKEIKAKKKTGEIKFEKTNTVMKTLLKKEYRRYISVPVYVVNTFFGMVLLLVFAVLTIFVDKQSIISQIMDEPDMAGVTFPLFPVVLLIMSFMILMSSTTSSSISLEGKNFWILKTLPISIKKILNSKLLFNILVVLPISLAAFIVMFFTLDLTLVELLIGILFVVLISLFVAQFGIIINLKFPKLDYINETQVVKQSMSSFICIMGPMLLVMVIPIIYIVVSSIIGTTAFICIVCTLLLLSNILFHLLINNWGVKRFNQI